MAFYSTGTTKAKERRKQRAIEHDRAVINAFYTDDSGQFPRTVPLKQIRWLSGFVGWLQTRSAKRQRFDWCRSIGFTDVETGHRVIVGDRTLRIGGDAMIYAEILTYQMLDLLTLTVPRRLESGKTTPWSRKQGGTWWFNLQSATYWSQFADRPDLRRESGFALKYDTEEEVVEWLAKQWSFPEEFHIRHSGSGVVFSSPDGESIWKKTPFRRNQPQLLYTREQLDAKYGPKKPCPSFLQPVTEETAR